MPLRTVRAQTPKKRSYEGPSSSRRRMEKHSSRHASGLSPPRKRMTPSIVKNRSTGRTGTDPVNKKRVEDHKSPGLRVRDGNNDKDRSPKRQKRKKDLVPLPFGRILADSPK